MNILVVDDEKTARSLLVETLKSNGEKVFEAEDGRQALVLLEKEKIDLVLTDRAMPVLDGIGLLQALRDRNSTVPVVMISAYGEEKLWGQALGLGAKDYLLKPFEVKEVFRVVERYRPKGKATK